MQIVDAPQQLLHVPLHPARVQRAGLRHERAQITIQSLEDHVQRTGLVEHHLLENHHVLVVQIPQQTDLAHRGRRNPVFPSSPCHLLDGHSPAVALIHGSEDLAERATPDGAQVHIALQIRALKAGHRGSFAPLLVTLLSISI
eukprot:scaffold707_cov240-Pinguiococcus_pyrenoidosus.AAC.10